MWKHTKEDQKLQLANKCYMRTIIRIVIINMHLVKLSHTNQNFPGDGI